MLARRRRKECSRFSTQLCNSTVCPLWRTPRRGTSVGIRRLRFQWGVGSDGLPVSVQLVASRVGGEDLLLDVAAELEELLRRN